MPIDPSQPAELAGLLIVAGTLAFLIGAGNPALFPVWTSPEEMGLRTIHAHATAWRVTSVLFIVAAALTAPGIWILGDVVGHPLTRTGAVSWLLAMGAWMAHVAVRIGVTPGEAERVAGGAAIDPAYRLIGAWSGTLFALFTYLAAAALIAIGLTLLGPGGGLAPWIVMGTGAIAIMAMVVTGDVPPFVLFIGVGVIGTSALFGWP